MTSGEARDCGAGTKLFSEKMQLVCKSVVQSENLNVKHIFLILVSYYFTDDL